MIIAGAISTFPFLLFQLPDFSTYIEHYGAIGILIWFLIFDQFTPIPAEISLLIIGYLTANGYFDPVWAITASFFGFLIIDLIYYYLTRSGSKFITKIISKINKNFIDRYKQKMEKHMPLTLLVLIFIPRMRVLGPILVGLLKINVKKFLLYDSIGLAFFSTLFVLLGIIFHRTLHSVMEDELVIRHIIFICFVTLATIALILWLRRRVLNNHNGR